MIPAVVTDPISGQPVVLASVERERAAIEKEIKDACSEFLNEPDWEKNMAIVDQLNRAPYLCTFAVQEIRMQLKTKNPEIEILALQLTETVIKNVPSSHASVAHEDFMRYMIKVGTDERAGGKWTQLKSKMKKKNASMNSKQLRSQCVERALLILKMLAMAYGESALYPVFKATYNGLLAQKVRFPETNKDESLNVFSPMHSSGAADEFGAGGSVQMTSALGSLGSVPNPNMPMIRPVVPIEGVSDPKLVQAQEAANLLFDMVNAPILSYDLIPDLTAMLNQAQSECVAMISDGNAPELVLMQALQVNDIVNQVLEDAQEILNGTRRRYQPEVNVQSMLAMSGKDDGKVGDDDEEDNGEEEVSLEKSVSIENGGGPGVGHSGAAEMFALSGPTKESAHKRNKSAKKGRRQSVDLLGMDANTNNNNSSNGGDGGGVASAPKQESEEDLMGFLGIQNNGHHASAPPPQPQQPQPMIFDPLMEAPAPAYASAYHNNNGNFNHHNNNMLSAAPRSGEASHSIHSSVSSSPQVKNILQPQPAILNNNTNNNNNSEFDTGNDPFAALGLVDNNTPQSPPQPTTARKPTPKPQAQQPAANMASKPASSNTQLDPFSALAGSAFDDPTLNTTTPKPQPPAPQKRDSNKIILDMFASGPPDPNLDKSKYAATMTTATSAVVAKRGTTTTTASKNTNQANDNPFDAMDNPFAAASTDNLAAAAAADHNPFDALDNPFASDADLGASSSKLDANNPFASPMPQKKDEFMGDRDPFADM